MEKYFLVYYTPFDTDFDNYPPYRYLGVYDNEDKAKEICDKDFWGCTYYKEYTVGG